MDAPSISTTLSQYSSNSSSIFSRSSQIMSTTFPLTCLIHATKLIHLLKSRKRFGTFLLCSIIDLYNRQSHFLAGLLLNEIDNAITQDQEEIRLKAVEALRYQLRKHDFDPRYQDVEKRKMVAGIYFPFILTMIDNASTIKRARRYERRNWLICFLFLLKGTKCNVYNFLGIRKRLLRDWWKKETLQRKQRMFEMISSILHTFEVHTNYHSFRAVRRKKQNS